ncbi:hypothetical protein CXB51_024954 [Gossypium anomalum]|uniref:CCHC-type domain-containing protein n=1 Tax=Gossypium anomalum TaxID=47600 RepID=A0A8J6CU83_9ROSI|nr:hypothetical protein CXB51_024954 [Gossypium anomalum]
MASPSAKTIQELDIALEEKPDKEWAKINRQACGTIRLCLAKEQKYSVMRETSAKKLWDTLEEKFLTKSLENSFFMKKKLYRFTYAPSMSMNDHVNSFNKILADLLNLDEKYEDEDKVLFLLNSLSNEYDHLTTTLLHGKDTITFDAVCSVLYRFETRKKDKRDHRETIIEVLTVRGHSHSNKLGRRSKSKGRPSKDECTFCREKGHWKKNCPKLKKGKAISNACVAEHDDESNFRLVGMAMACHTDESILDLGCNYHMCPNRDWFSSLKELKCVVVFMDNDSACKTMGLEEKSHLLESKGLTITLRDGLLKVVAGIQRLLGYGIYAWDMLVKNFVEFGEARLVERPTKVASLGGTHDFVTFVDDYSRKVWIMVGSTRMIHFYKYVKMRALCDTSCSGYTTVDWGGRTYESDYTRESLMYVVQC